MSDTVFNKLNAINVNEHTEKKNNLTYLSWAWAWAEVKKHYPNAFYTIYENAEGLFYHHDGKTAWVKTGVTIEGLEHIEFLPVMDFKNKSISADSITSVDVNKAIQRSLTKAVARHGLGLYIYAGEDLPEGEAPDRKDKASPAPADEPEPPNPYISEATAERIMKGLSVVAGDKVADQRSVLNNICGLTDVYKIEAENAQMVFDKLVAMAKEKEAKDAGQDN